MWVHLYVDFFQLATVQLTHTVLLTAVQACIVLDSTFWLGIHMCAEPILVIRGFSTVEEVIACNLHIVQESTV